MTTSPDDPRNIRVGTAEREAAIAALGEHWRAGRLDPAEHEARTTKAFNAVTRADLDALFVDLPPRPADSTSGTGWPAGPSPGNGSGGAGAQQPAPSGGPVGPRGSGAGRRRDVVMALMPFVCLLLFFTVARTWLVWLLIPIVAIFVYGADGTRGGRGH
ncbi:MAG: DUF1707 SHOCT-like domain-containing protein [Dermatophilaceae bacterium]